MAVSLFARSIGPFLYTFDLTLYNLKILYCRVVAGGTFDVMDTCAATQDESDVEASNETSTDSCPRISNVSLSCRPFKSYAEFIASNAAFNLIIMFMLLFYLQYHQILDMY